LPHARTRQRLRAREGIKFQLWDDDSNETGNIANRSFLGKVKIEPEVRACAEIRRNPTQLGRRPSGCGRQTVRRRTNTRSATTDATDGPAPAERSLPIPRGRA
jgi:hypothetical protein